MHFTPSQLERYSRHIILKEVGAEGQYRLLQAKVLVIGAGGLGSPALLYLAAAGVGTIGIVDHDHVELSNLQRQIIHSVASIGEAKAASAEASLQALNPDLTLITYPTRLTAENAAEIVASYDIVLDGSDNFETRFLVNDSCIQARITLISAAIRQFEGYLSVYKPHADARYPCYRCLHPEGFDDELSCTRGGILGSIAGVMGTLQATEALKEILQLGESLAGTLLTYNALTAHFRRITLPRDPECASCRNRA